MNNDEDKLEQVSNLEQKEIPNSKSQGQIQDNQMQNDVEKISKKEFDSQKLIEHKDLSELDAQFAADSKVETPHLESVPHVELADILNEENERPSKEELG